MYRAYPICHIDGYINVSAGRWNLLWYHVPWSITYNHYAGSSIPFTADMVVNFFQNFKWDNGVYSLAYVDLLSYRIEAVQMIFVIIAASMAALGFMILFVGFLATGATRYKIYKAWRSRVGGRISCAVVRYKISLS